MRENAESKIQSIDDSRSSLVESLSEPAIRRELRSAAMQHPATIFPFTLCILSIIYLLLLSPVLGGALWAIILLSCSGAVAVGCFFWLYSIRYSQAYARRLQEVMSMQEQEQRGLEQAELRQLREDLQSGFASINSTVGLKATKKLVYEYDQLQRVLRRKKETDPLSVAHIPALTEETYRQGLSVLGDVLELERVVHSSDKQGLEKEIVELERGIESLRGDETQAEQVKIKEATVTSHKERVNMIKEQQLRVDQLVYQSDRCEASLHRTRIELAALTAESSETSVSAVTETLEKTINQAKEVQEELKRLGY